MLINIFDEFVVFIEHLFTACSADIYSCQVIKNIIVYSVFSWYLQLSCQVIKKIWHFAKYPTVINGENFVGKYGWE